MTTSSFDALGLRPELLRAVAAAGYDRPTPIQAKAIGHVLDGRDLFGCAQTGTGKTAAFALPILQRLAGSPPPGGRRPVRVLVLAPTRELALQVEESFRTYGRHLPLSSAVIHGGVSERPQVDALQRGVDVLVATPGRLLDLMGQGHIKLDRVEVLVLDEADRMLDMGFIHDIRKVVAKVPSQRQTLLFSATVPHEIRQLAAGLLRDPVDVSVTPPSTAAETVDQSVYFVAKPDKQALLRHLLDDREITRALVFTRTKHGADRVARQLMKAHVKAEAIHGNKSQNARLRALRGFQGGTTRVLVASDIASRGLDIDEVSHVINFDLPNEPETYVHRIGRTGRAGAAGVAVSFCDQDERPYLKDIEKLIRRPLRVVSDHPFPTQSHRPRVVAGAFGRQQPGAGEAREEQRRDEPREAGRREPRDDDRRDDDRRGRSERHLTPHDVRERRGRPQRRGHHHGAPGQGHEGPAPRHGGRPGGGGGRSGGGHGPGTHHGHGGGQRRDGGGQRRDGGGRRDDGGRSGQGGGQSQRRSPYGR